VDDDAERGRQRVEAALDDRYGYFGLGGRLHAVAVSGPPDAVARGLREVADAGAELLLLNPLFDDDEQMERLAAEVVPQLS
jgi:alkanesulfonate monooxygenase SsuD/methylene tetrahydromethanopterin reductase-like flavin-dependent oxidoreductase (luciferase family)